MKIYKTELAEPAALENLVLGGAAVPDPEVEPPEIEWQLLQSPPAGKVGIWEQSANGGEAGAGSEAVSRRYEFYKYTGQYDPDSDNFHEALCDNPVGGDPRCRDPDANGVAGVGDLIGAQNTAVNLVPVCAADVSASISMKRSGYVFNFGTKLVYQRVTLTNTSASTVFGPISVANTAPLAGLAGPFAVAFQLTDGSGLGGSAGGCPANCTTTGGASGDMTGAVTLTDSSFFNSFAERFTEGSTL